ncbi:hypothetical protein KIPB_009945, partial [Kipferlia bialata]|eukprot:g9945.t1
MNAYLRNSIRSRTRLLAKESLTDKDERGRIEAEVVSLKREREILMRYNAVQ